MVYIGSKPILINIIDTLSELNINNILIIVSSKIDLSSFNRKVKITQLIQKQPLGTGHAWEIVKNKVQFPCLLLYGDMLYEKKELKKMLTTFSYKEHRFSILLYNIGCTDMSIYSCAKWKGTPYKSFISEVIDKPSPNQYFSNDIPIAFTLPIEIKSIQATKKNKLGEIDIYNLVTQFLNNNWRASGVRAIEWIHITTMEDLFYENMRWIKKHGSFVHKDSLIDPYAIVKNSIITDNCIINEDCINSIVFPRTIVNSPIKNSIIWENQIYRIQEKYLSHIL